MSSETYCACLCPLCGQEFREWIELYVPSVLFADCYCSNCKRIVSAKVVPFDLHYRL